MELSIDDQNVSQNIVCALSAMY